MPDGGELFREGRGLGSRVVAEEAEDGGHEWEGRFRVAAFPVDGGVGAEVQGDVPLEQAAVEAAGSQVFAQGSRTVRIVLGLGLRGGQRHPAVGQRDFTYP